LISTRTTPARPPRLRPGDRVALVAPAGPASEEKIQRSIERCHAFGLQPVVAASARKRHGFMAGTDAERAADLQTAFDDESIAAIWAVRGGYGAMRLLDQLDFGQIQHRPKPFIGFSDNTALHLAFSRSALVSFLGPHASERFPDETATTFRRVLFEAEAPGLLPVPAGEPPVSTLSPGMAEGELIGGNLSLLATACGTRFSLEAHGRIVVIEDIGEPEHHIDRTLTQLALSGALDGAVAIAFGRFTNIPETPNDLPLDQVLREWVEPLRIPAVLGLPFGHVDQNWTLPLGARCRLDADAGTLEILDPAVT